MKLFNTFTHMPFVSGNTLYLCHSAGYHDITIPQTNTAIRLKIPPQTVRFQPWFLGSVENGVISPITIRGFETVNPTSVFCNPVVTGDSISFIYNANLYTASLSENTLPTLRKENVGSGFFDGRLITTQKNDGPSGKLYVDGELVELACPQIIRVIPHNDGFIITCKDNDVYSSYVVSVTGELSRITVSGFDVYKCCIDGDYVIYAKKEGDFEDRFLYRELLTLTPI